MYGGDGLHNGPNRPNLHTVLLQRQNPESGEGENELLDWLLFMLALGGGLHFNHLLERVRPAEDANEADDDGGEDEDENEELINDQILENVEVIDVNYNVDNIVNEELINDQIPENVEVIEVNYNVDNIINIAFNDEVIEKIFINDNTNENDHQDNPNIQGFYNDVDVNDDCVNEAWVSEAGKVDVSLKRPREEDESVESSTDLSSESDPGFHRFKKRKTRHQAEEEDLLPPTSRKRSREKDESETDNSSKRSRLLSEETQEEDPQPGLSRKRPREEDEAEKEESGKRSRLLSEETQEEEPHAGPSRRRQRDHDAEDDNPGGKKKRKRNHLE